MKNHIWPSSALIFLGALFMAHLLQIESGWAFATALFVHLWIMLITTAFSQENSRSHPTMSFAERVKKTAEQNKRNKERNNETKP